MDRSEYRQRRFELMTAVEHLDRGRQWLEMAGLDREAGRVDDIVYLAVLRRVLLDAEYHDLGDEAA